MEINMISGLLTSFKRIILENKNVFLLCKKCGNKIKTPYYYSSGHNGIEFDGTILRCENYHCVNYRNDFVSLTENDIILMKFNSYEAKDEYFHQIELINDSNRVKLRIKENAEDFKEITKRKGKHEYNCKCCNKKILAGERVFRYASDFSYYRGRRMISYDYICIECFKKNS